MHERNKRLARTKFKENKLSWSRGNTLLFIFAIWNQKICLERSWNGLWPCETSECTSDSVKRGRMTRTRRYTHSIERRVNEINTALTTGWPKQHIAHKCRTLNPQRILYAYKHSHYTNLSSHLTWQRVRHAELPTSQSDCHQTHFTMQLHYAAFLSIALSIISLTCRRSLPIQETIHILSYYEHNQENSHGYDLTADVISCFDLFARLPRTLVLVKTDFSSEAQLLCWQNCLGLSRSWENLLIRSEPSRDQRQLATRQDSSRSLSSRE